MKIVIVGAGGRMGRALVRDVTAADGMVVHAATEHEGNALLGQDAGTLAGLEPLGVTLTDKVLEAIVDADAVIDFTTPAATVEHAALAAQARIVHVIGTTGLSDEDEEKIKAAARHATIIKAGNFSLGVNLLAALTRKVASMLDEDWDIEISETHHRNKVDAPSGTALMLGEAAAEGRGKDLKDIADRGRDGITGARKRGDIGLVALRGGSVVGDHTVMFAAENEILELTHRAGDRTIFARGAVRAARWGKGKPPGLYDMADVLELD